MQYELFNWEKKRVSDSDLDHIKAAFMSVLVSSEPEIAIQRYVRMHQKGILLLSRDTSLEDRLSELSDFLERHAAAYLDQGAPLPHFRRLYFADRVRGQMPVVGERLQAIGAEPRLSELIAELCRETIQDDDLTYRQWFPLMDLIDFVLQLSPSVKGDLSVSQRIVEHLYCLNINTTPLYRYIKATIEEVVEDKEFVYQKLPELGRVKRYVNWLEHKPGYQFVEGRVSLTQMLSAWLEELSRLKEKEAQEAGEEGKDDDSGFGLDSQKVITSLTVNELGLLVRLFMETGVFRTRNRKGLARFMAKNVVTLKKEAIDEVSTAHLYGTLYSMTDATLDSVQSILNRMLVRLGKLRLEQRQKNPAVKKVARKSTAKGKK